MVGVRARGPDGDAGHPRRTHHRVPTVATRPCAMPPASGCVEIGAPMDVLWLRLSKHADDPAQTLGRIDAGRIFIMLDRDDYWQCAFVIPKGGIDEVSARGLDAFRARNRAHLAPFLRDRVHELASWDDVKLLTVAVNRLEHLVSRPACCASATPRMRCRRSAASASTWRSRTPSPPPISWCRACPEGGVTLDDLRAVQRRRAVADAHDAAHPGGRAESRHQQRAARHRDADAAVRRADAWARSPCCGACRRALSAWASAPSTSGTEQPVG